MRNNLTLEADQTQTTLKLDDDDDKKAAQAGLLMHAVFFMPITDQLAPGF